MSKPIIKRLLTGTVLSILAAALLSSPPTVLSVFLVVTYYYLMLGEMPNFWREKSLPLKFFTFTYLTASFASMVFINESPFRSLLFFLFLLVFCFDTAAYCIGSLCGKHPLASKISPGKTWEGFWGGYLFVFVVSALSFHGFPIFFSLWICILATLGDLFESYLKRRVGLKDSGTLLPGHGGVFDRIDSLLPVALYCGLLYCVFVLRYNL